MEKKENTDNSYLSFGFKEYQGNNQQKLASEPRV
jgi:hypothetical protein